MPNLAKTYFSIAITLMAGSILMFWVPDLIIDLLTQSLSVKPLGPFTGANKIAGTLIFLISLMMLLEAWNARKTNKPTQRRPIPMTQTLATQCDDCQGTGLKIGWAELKGAAIVCRKCQGTGQYLVAYTPFTGRKQHPNAIRVWRQNPGYRITPDQTSGGVPVATWLLNPQSVNEPEAAMQAEVCPALWYGDNPFPQCDKILKYTDCPWWRAKEACWQTYQPPKPEPADPNVTG